MRRLLKLQILIPAVVLLIALVIFGGWYLIPSRSLNIVLLDKAVTSSGTSGKNSIADYRKHYGLYWMLNQLKINNPETNRPYNYKTDYYGILYDNTGTAQINSMARLNKTPDIVYLSDAYGSNTGTGENQESAENSGLTYEDISAAAVAHDNGATLIGEQDSLSDKPDASVQKELDSLFGISDSNWKGRYFADLSDLSDVPDWALSLNESLYGSKWDYSGPGILLVSQKGELIVLQQGKDFDYSALTISVADSYQKEFGKHSLKYYNWFEIIDASYNSETLAEYHLNLTDDGKQKFSAVSDRSVFPAIVRVKGSNAPSYYFAGNFTDYVASNRFSKFLFSNSLYQMFSYDRPGDITNFYWNFYYPFMDTVLNEAQNNKGNVHQPHTNSESAFRIDNNKFEQLVGQDWKPFTLKGFDINAAMPGHASGDYTRDISVYSQFISGISDMGGNCIRAYDLLPPEFYRALYEYDLNNPDKTVYLMQSIRFPDTVSGADALSDQPQDALRKNIAAVIDAVHGKGDAVPFGSGNSGTYITDISPFLIGYLIDTSGKSDTISQLNSNYSGYTYSGDYISGNSSAAEGLAAMLCDYTYSYQQDTYGYISAVGAEGDAGLAANQLGTSLNMDDLVSSDKTAGSFFVSYKLNSNDTALLSNTAAYSSYTDDNGSFPYGGYIQKFKQTQKNHPVLIDKFGLSTNTNAFEKETSVNGLTETQQGEGIVRMLKAINKEGYLGGIIGDYNDNWSDCSSDYAPFELPAKDNPLWLNTLDLAQTNGVAAMEPTADDANTLILKDTDRMKEMKITSDAAYIYLSIQLDGAIDYDKQQLMIGLDTYQRNNGEYRYDPGYFATSLSGMEYVIKFESKNTAALYVVPSYDRSKQQYSSKESYNGNYDYVCQLVYGSFDTSGTNFFQAGSTIQLRLPWNLLNFTDPAKKLVINDTRSGADIAADTFGIQTTNTDGILFSLLLADKQTKDSLYVFPKSKQDSGYKAYTWSTWSQVSFTIRQKDSCKIIGNFFQAN